MDPDVLLTAADVVGDYNAASANQIFQMYEGAIWKTTRFLIDVRTKQIPADVHATVAGLCKVGMLLGFGLVVVQILLDFAVNVVGHGVHPLRILQKNIMRVLLCAILLTPVSYEWICIRAIGNTADNIADAVSGAAGEQMMRNVKGMFSAASGKEEVMENGQKVSKLKAASIFVVSLGGNLVTGLISGVVFIVAMVFILLMPMLQSALFVFVFYLGPICLPFMLFDITAGIAKAWFGFLLSVSFMGVVGAISMLVSSTAKISNSLTFGGQTENVVFMLIYGLLSIVLMAMCYPVAASLFGNTGGVAGIMQPLTLSNAAKAAAVATGGTLAIGAAVTKGVGAVAEKLGAEKLGNTLKNAGGTLSETRDHLKENRDKNRKGQTLPESPNVLTSSMGDLARDGWNATGGRIFRGPDDKQLPRQQYEERQRPFNEQQLQQPFQQMPPHEQGLQEQERQQQRPQNDRPQSGDMLSDPRDSDNRRSHEQPSQQGPRQSREQQPPLGSQYQDLQSGGHASLNSGSGVDSASSHAGGSGTGVVGGGVPGGVSSSGSVNVSGRDSSSSGAGGMGVSGGGVQSTGGQGDNSQAKRFSDMEDLSKSRQRDLANIEETSRSGKVTGGGNQSSGGQSADVQYSQRGQFVGQAGSFNSSVSQSQQSPSSGSGNRQKEDSGRESRSPDKASKKKEAKGSPAQTDSTGNKGSDTENVNNTSEKETDNADKT